MNNEFVKSLVKLYDQVAKVASEKEINKQRCREVTVVIEVWKNLKDKLAFEEGMAEGS